MRRRATQLSPRQRDVVALIVARLSCPQIAKRLGITERTVRHHVEDAAAKIEADKELPAIRRLRKHGPALLDGSPGNWAVAHSATSA